MSEPSRIDLHLGIDGFTLKIDNVEVEVDIHGSCKSMVFWRLLTSTTPFWKIVEGDHKTYIHFEGVMNENSTKALRALEKIRTLSRKKTEELLKMPLDDMCRKLVLEALVEA